jgi:hypothetical protein
LRAFLGLPDNGLRRVRHATCAGRAG